MFSLPALDNLSVFNNIRGVFQRSHNRKSTSDYHALPIANDGEIPEKRLLPITQQVEVVSWKIPAALTLTFCIGLFLRGYRVHQIHSDQQCTARMSAYSPLLDVVRYNWKQEQSEYRPDEFSGYPNILVEGAWKDLLDYDAFGFPYDHIPELNKSITTTQFLRPKGIAENQAVAITEMYHQVHCVDIIRCWIYRAEWKYQFTHGDNMEVVRVHIDHCIMTLKTNILCHSDVTPSVLTMNSQFGLGKSYTAPRKCRNYGELAQWVRDHKVEYNV